MLEPCRPCDSRPHLALSGGRPCSSSSSTEEMSSWLSGVSVPSVPARPSERAVSSWKERQATGKTPICLQASEKQPSRETVGHG